MEPTPLPDAREVRDSTAEDISTSAPGLFYWELPPEERARLRAENLIVVGEGYLAHDINWGRQLLALRPDPTEVPDVAESWAGIRAPEDLSDAISALLQVAVEEGLDPVAVAAAAIETHYAIREWSFSAIRRA